MIYEVVVLSLALVAEFALIAATSYVISFRGYCDALGVSKARRPWYGR